MKNKTLPGIALSITAGICWGFSGTVGQYLFTTYNMDAGWLTIIRLIVSGLLLLLIALLRRDRALKTIWQTKKSALHLVAFGIVGLMMVQYGYMQAIYFSNSGTATAIQYSGEALVLIYSCVVGRRLPKIAELIGLFLALLGIFLLATHGDVHNMILSTNGILWGIIAAVALMLYTVIPGNLVRAYGSSVVTGYGMLIGGVVLAFLLRFWNLPGVSEPGALIGLGAVILIGTVVGFSLYLTSIAWIGPLKAGLIASIETVAAPMFSRLWLKTQFAAMDYVGFALILIMVVLLAVPELRASRISKSNNRL